MKAVLSGLGIGVASIGASYLIFASVFGYFPFGSHPREFGLGTQTSWQNSTTTTECWRRDGNTILHQECEVSHETILTVLGQENDQVIVRIEDGPYVALVDKDDFRYFIARARYLKERDQLVLRHLPN